MSLLEICLQANEKMLCSTLALDAPCDSQLSALSYQSGRHFVAGGVVRQERALREGYSILRDSGANPTQRGAVSLQDILNKIVLDSHQVICQSNLWILVSLSLLQFWVRLALRDFDAWITRVTVSLFRSASLLMEHAYIDTLHGACIYCHSSWSKYTVAPGLRAIHHS